jgi:MYXO-CTERM domain-containing protein
VVVPCLVLIGRPGFTPATITEQRARLPPPAFCDDEVEGVWRSHYYRPRFHEWYVMTLEVHRVRGNPTGLTGVIHTEYWDGFEGQQEPPVSCSPGSEHRLIRQPATGGIVNGEIFFGGTSWSTDRVFCDDGSGGYNPDNFSGRIDPEIQEFQSVNNDGGIAVNEPAVFRRIKCFDAPAAVPTISVSPPPPFSSKRRGSCQCALGSPQPGGCLGAMLLPVVAAAARRRRRRGRP